MEKRWIAVMTRQARSGSERSRGARAAQIPVPHGLPRRHPQADRGDDGATLWFW